LTHQFPEPMGFAAKTVLGWMISPVAYLLDRFEEYILVHVSKYIDAKIRIFGQMWGWFTAMFGPY